MINVEIRKERTSMELLEKVLDDKNLYKAYKQVYKNKGASGIDGVTVDELGQYMYLHKEEIKEQIRNRKYQPSPVRRVYIPKENGDKRGLGIPTVVDRLIQQAIVQVLTPIYEEQFSETSYGFRPNRSCEAAIVKLLEYFNDGYTWIVDIDLQKFFDTVCHDKLISIIMKTIHDGELVSLIRKYLVSGVMESGVIIPTKVGTPQGGNLSPLLSNIMLNELDKELEKRGLRYTRYADDCIIVVKSEKAANRVMESITKFIEKKLGLKVNVEKSKIARPNQIKYLGFGFYITKTGIIKPKPHLKSIQKFKRRLKQLTKRSWNISLDERIAKLNPVIRGWINYFRIADMKENIKNITSHLNRRIRCIIWKQWKTPRHRTKCLMKLGLNKDTAKSCSYSRKSYWCTSKCIPLHKAISNKRIQQKGLVFPLDHYLKVHTQV
ncbi:MAG TPA: group II intron reverse transcriptase/maturase [[Clostridium] spiroforme]|uniref:RNA-directed DNA polymerase n=1 Tax=Thomasclavelia spiroformis TaxID=29348 RepID=A0A921G952_9FIRM|nr:group II intron reverse transcriptase/maturase [Thomasclavelia spiroformis]